MLYWLEKEIHRHYQDIAIDAVRRQLLLEKNFEEAEEGCTLTLLEKGEATWTAEIYPTEIIDLFECRFDIEFLNPKALTKKPIQKHSIYLDRLGLNPMNVLSYSKKRRTHF